MAVHPQKRAKVIEGSQPSFRNADTLSRVWRLCDNLSTRILLNAWPADLDILSVLLGHECGGVNWHLWSEWKIFDVRPLHKDIFINCIHSPVSRMLASFWLSKILTNKYIKYSHNMCEIFLRRNLGDAFVTQALYVALTWLGSIREWNRPNCSPFPRRFCADFGGSPVNPMRSIRLHTRYRLFEPLLHHPAAMLVLIIRINASLKATTLCVIHSPVRTVCNASIGVAPNAHCRLMLIWGSLHRTACSVHGN